MGARCLNACLANPQQRSGPMGDSRHIYLFGFSFTLNFAIMVLLTENLVNNDCFKLEEVAVTCSFSEVFDPINWTGPTFSCNMGVPWALMEF